MSALRLRNVVVTTRVVTGLLAGVSLALFVIVIDNVYNFDYGTKKAWMSILPAAALVIAILWNIVAITMGSRLRFYVHAFGDLIAVGLLATLGAIGFAHDNFNYLNNGFWRDVRPRNYDNWLKTEIAAASILLATCIFQLVLVFMGCFQYRYDRTESRSKCKVCGCQNGAGLERMETGVVKIGVGEERKSLGAFTASSDIDVEEKHQAVRMM